MSSPVESRTVLVALALVLGMLVVPAAVASVPVVAGARAAACQQDGYLWTHLHACGWPSARTTGPTPGACPRHRLQRLGTDPRGTIHLTRAGKRLTCKRITGCVSIEAPRVTLRNIAVRCTSGRTGEDANGTAVVTVEDGASAVLKRIRIDGMDGVHACVWHNGRSVVVNRMDCAHVNDGVFSWSEGASGGNHFTVADSYLHDFTTKTANGHVDGYQTEGASHGRIVHNTFLMTSDDNNSSNSAVAIWDGLRDSTDITVADNLIAGGGFAVYAEDYSPSETQPIGGYSVTDVRISGNVFSRRLFDCVGYWGIWYPRGAPTDGWRRAGNRVLGSAQDVNVGNPSVGSRICT